MNILRIKNIPIDSNCYLLWNENNNGIIIDPGSKDPDVILSVIEQKSIIPHLVILTHEHFDHIWCAEAIRQKYGSKIVATQAAAQHMSIPQNYFNLLYYNDPTFFSIQGIDIQISENKIVEEANMQISCILTPGHTSGSMVVQIENNLFTGDTILYKTKPVLRKKDGADKKEFFKSVQYIRNTFPPETQVCPGHGDTFLLKDY